MACIFAIQIVDHACQLSLVGVSAEHRSASEPKSVYKQTDRNDIFEER